MSRNYFYCENCSHFFVNYQFNFKKWLSYRFDKIYGRFLPDFGKILREFVFQGSELLTYATIRLDIGTKRSGRPLRLKWCMSRVAVRSGSIRISTVYQDTLRSFSVCYVIVFGPLPPALALKSGRSGRHTEAANFANKTSIYIHLMTNLNIWINFHLEEEAVSLHWKFPLSYDDSK